LDDQIFFFFFSFDNHEVILNHFFGR
jgi:hypothetical protein